MNEILWNKFHKELAGAVSVIADSAKKIIDKFEKEKNVSIEDMDKTMSPLLLKDFSEGKSYSTAWYYMRIVNRYLEFYNKETGKEVSYLKNLKRFYTGISKFYYDIDDMINDIEKSIEILISEKFDKLTPAQLRQATDRYCPEIAMLILLWYGVSRKAICLMEKEHIKDHKIMLPEYSREIMVDNERAWEYLCRCKEVRNCVIMRRHLCTIPYADNKYLLRSIKSTTRAFTEEPFTTHKLTMIKVAFLKETGIDDTIEWSGFFSTIKSKYEDEDDLRMKFQKYFIDHSCGDINLKVHWYKYVDNAPENRWE